MREWRRISQVHPTESLLGRAVLLAQALDGLNLNERSDAAFADRVLELQRHLVDVGELQADHVTRDNAREQRIDALPLIEEVRASFAGLDITPEEMTERMQRQAWESVSRRRFLDWLQIHRDELLTADEQQELDEVWESLKLGRIDETERLGES